MARNGTFDSKRTEARRLFDAGLSCRAIADNLKVSPSTISRWAKQEGLKFDRSKVEAAVKAHTVDLAAARIRLAEKMSAAAEEMLDHINDPYLVFSFGGKENDYNEHTLDSAPVETRRNIVTTAGIAFDKLTRIVEKSDDGLEDALGVIGTLAVGFEEIARIARATQETLTDES